MNIAIINVVGIEGSTGKIASKFARRFSLKGHRCKIFYGRGGKGDYNTYVKKGCLIDNVLHYLLAKGTGKEGYYSTFFTKKIVDEIKQFMPDRVIILNLHGHWLNIPLLMDEISCLDTKIEWFMCDEYPFTARCEYTYGCSKYKDGCIGCTRFRNISKLYYDKSRYYNRIINKTVFSSVSYIVNRAKESSLLQEASFAIRNTGIDTDYYKPIKYNVFRDEYGISEEKILLIDVAPYSNKRKGVEMFIETARLMVNDKRFVFVNVGYDGKRRIELPNFIAIPYVDNQERLREIYSAADRYICTSVDDALPNACVEAMSCGTPILAFNVSGMPFLADYPILTLVDIISAEGIMKAVKLIEKKTDEISELCRNEAIEKYNFDSFADKFLE